jgi:hypothetical protein
VGISASLGLSKGDAPLQRSFSFETPISSFAYPHSFRTLRTVNTFADNFYACAIEHNFRNIPLLLAGVTSVNADVLLRVTTGIM